eukprot:Phypoly_transcript_29456.p1 GENE.Phypoly_transcript_29456~~Phypoly_transcript_29456.p1  ORF type:complete len:122 (+),score=23.59 Phypoly_transcript_29456:63-428(+)
MLAGEIDFGHNSGKVFVISQGQKEGILAGFSFGSSSSSFTFSSGTAPTMFIPTPLQRITRASPFNPLLLHPLHTHSVHPPRPPLHPRLRLGLVCLNKNRWKWWKRDVSSCDTSQLCKNAIL